MGCCHSLHLTFLSSSCTSVCKRKNLPLCSSCMCTFKKLGSKPDHHWQITSSACALKSIAFNLLVARHEHTWSSLIIGYIECGESRRAFSFYQKMRKNSLHPSGHTFVPLLKECAKLRDLHRGIALYADIVQEGVLVCDIFVGSTLVHMFVKCGSLAKAREVFDTLLVRNVVAWNALIAGYAKHKQGEEALNCFEQMQLEGIAPNAVTFICCLKACGNIGAIDKGCEIHDEILEKGLLNTDCVLGSALVDMYAKCGMLSKAQNVFDKLRVRNVDSWNALIAGYANHEHSKKAIKCFEQMKFEGVIPDAITFTTCLKACSSLKAVDKGCEIHTEIDSRQETLKKDIVLGSALVDMYAKCGVLEKAQDICKNLGVRDVISWTALIAGYTEHERGEDALDCFERMQFERVSPDAVTFACCLKACGTIGATSKGREIHAELERRNVLHNHLYVGNALVDMYTKFGLLANAREVFDRLPKRDTFSWNALIAGYSKHERGEEALLCLEQMRHKGVPPDAITYTCCLTACGSIVAIDKGKELHTEIERSGLLERDVAVGNALIDMYAKCGSLTKARGVFDIINRDLVSWNTLIAGYAQLGESDDVFDIFERTKHDCKKPDSATFACVLKACNHAGLLDKAEMYFISMINDYGIIPSTEHFTCVLDMLGRAGRLDKAVAMMVKLPFHPDVAMWCIVLCACRKWGNLELGKRAFEEAVRLDDKESALYVCMCNIYADAGMQEAAN